MTYELERQQENRKLDKIYKVLSKIEFDLYWIIGVLILIAVGVWTQ